MASTTDEVFFVRGQLKRGVLQVTGVPLIIAFVVAIVLMIVLISKFKVHAFLSIMAISLLFAIVAGLELVKIPDIIGEGFSATFKSIGIVIILGALVGTLLEKTRRGLENGGHRGEACRQETP